MSNLESNLRIAAAENFRLYPEDYPIIDGKPTNECKQNLERLADGYGQHDGFYELGMTEDDVLNIVESEFQEHLLTY